MAIHNVITSENPILRQKAKKVHRFDSSISKLIEDMFETMHAAHGVGLAAPQIAISIRVFVAEFEDRKIALVNPEIIKAEGRIQEDEGCLSLPGVYGPTPRATQVVLRGMNRHGEIVEVEGEGLLARAFQHEMDHLQGMLFFNRMGPAARDIVIRKFKRAQRQRHERLSLE